MLLWASCKEGKPKDAHMSKTQHTWPVVPYMRMMWVFVSHACDTCCNCGDLVLVLLKGNPQELR